MVLPFSTSCGRVPVSPCDSPEELAESALHDRSSGHHEAILQTAFNKIITLDIFISWFDFEGKPHVLCTVSDISESKRMQAKLEKERALLRCLIDSAGDLIFINDVFAKDYRSFFVGRDDQYLKAPQNAIRAEYYNPLGALSFVWTPASELRRTWRF